MKVIRKAFHLALSTVLLALTAPAVLAQPTLIATQAPTAGDPGGNWLTLAARWFNDGSFILGAAVTVIALLGTAWFTYDKVSEARDPKSPTEWGDVGKTAIGGGLASMFGGALVASAVTVFQTA